MIISVCFYFYDLCIINQCELLEKTYLGRLEVNFPKSHKGPSPFVYLLFIPKKFVVPPGVCEKQKFTRAERGSPFVFKNVPTCNLTPPRQHGRFRIFCLHSGLE